MGKKQFLAVPSAGRLKELFDYADSGHLVWKVAKGYIKPGTIAGAARPNGYIQIMVDRKMYKAHRLIWAWHHGQLDPSSEIDHINGIVADNRIENLRTATITTNRENRHGAQKNNKLGTLGVQELRNGKFIAGLVLRGKRIHLGTFDTIQKAYKAYVTKKREMHKGNTL